MVRTGEARDAYGYVTGSTAVKFSYLSPETRQRLGGLLHDLSPPQTGQALRSPWTKDREKSSAGFNKSKVRFFAKADPKTLLFPIKRQT